MSFATHRMRAQQPTSVVSTLAPLKLSNVDSVPFFSNSGLIDYKQGFSIPTKLESTPENPPPGPILRADVTVVKTKKKSAAVSAEQAARQIAKQFTQSEVKAVPTKAKSTKTKMTPDTAASAQDETWTADRSKPLNARLSAVEEHMEHVAVGLDNHTAHIRQIKEGLHNHTEVLQKTVTGMHNHTAVLKQINGKTEAKVGTKQASGVMETGLDSKALMQKYSRSSKKCNKKMSASQVMERVQK